MLQLPNSAMDSWPRDTLIRIAKSGNAPAIVALLKAHSPLIQSYVNQCPSESREDAFQAGIIAFIEVINRYDQHRGVPIGAYARNFIKGAVFKTAARYTMRGVKTETIDAAYEIESFDEPDIDLRLTVETWLKTQPAETRLLVRLRFYEGLTQADIARRFGVSGAAISRRFKRIFEKARLDPHLAGSIA